MTDFSGALQDIGAAIGASMPAAPAAAPEQPQGLFGGAIADIQAALNPVAPAGPAPKPPAMPAGNGLTSLGTGILDNLAAGVQGVSPHGATGARLAPSEEQWAFGELGVPRDQQKYVALRNPETGHYSVYYRDPSMAESRAAPIGRALGLGVMDNFPSAVTAAAPNAAQNLLRDFERVGVTPNLPAIGQGRTSALVSNVANTLPVAGPEVRAATGATMRDTAAAAERAASDYGTATGPIDAGEVIQKGITNFAKGTAPEGTSQSDIIASPTYASGFGQKAGALYDRFGAMMDSGQPVSISNTLEALKGPLERFPTAPELGAKITNPTLQSYFGILAPGEKTIPAQLSSLVDASGNPIVTQALQKIQTGGELTFPELQEFRSSIGRSISDPSLISDIPRADLKNVYGAVSRDMEAAATQQGPAALNAFQKATQYYKAGIDRIDQLEPLLKGSPEQAFAAVNRAAGTGGSADAGLLTSLQRSMAPDEWRNVGATMIRKMGEPVANAKDALAESNFSPSSFATRWNTLSPEAKDTLFGANMPGSNREGLEALARVAQSQKNVSKLANQSHSGEYGLMGGMAVLALEHGDQLAAHPIATVTSILGAKMAAKSLMSPGFARWLYAMPQEIARAPNTMVGAQRALMTLDSMARLNPDLGVTAAKLHSVLDAPRGQAVPVR